MSDEAVQVSVEVEGPFFTKDPKKTLYANIADMLDGLAEWMEKSVRGEIQSHAGEMPHYTGWSYRQTQGYRHSPKTGKTWATWAAVGAVTAGMDRKNAIRTKAAAVTIERRFHPYRHTKSAIYRARAVLSADLTKGM